jgi:hypothetical protein
LATTQNWQKKKKKKKKHTTSKPPQSFLGEEMGVLLLHDWLFNTLLPWQL